MSARNSRQPDVESPGRRRGHGTMRHLLRWGRRTCLRLMDIRAGILLAVRPTDLADGGNGQAPFSVAPVSTVPDDYPLDPDSVSRRRRQGHALFGVLDGERLLAHGWVSPEGLTVPVLLHMRFTVPTNAIYIWDCETLSSERNRGHFRTLLRGILTHHDKCGMAYAAVDSGNRASRAALARIGFQQRFSYVGVRLFGRPAIGLALRGKRVLNGQRAFDEITDRAGGTPA